MEKPEEPLEPRLRAAALTVLRDHGIGADELLIERGKAGKTASSLVTGHRIRISLDDRTASLHVRAGHWTGRSVDYPSAGAFVAALEAALLAALAGR